MRFPFFFVLNFYILYGIKKKSKDPKLMNISSEPDKEGDWVYDYFSKEICIKRWNNGVSLYYLLNDQAQPCSFVWSRIGRIHYAGEINKNLVFQEDVNCFIDAITPTEHRGKGYYSYLMRAVADELSEYTSIAYAYRSNFISNKGLKRSGFIQTHILYCFFKFIKILPIKKQRIKFHVQS